MPARRVSMRQMMLLLEFLELNPDIAVGRHPGGPLAIQTSRNRWSGLALQLNAVPEGVNKTAEQSRRYWIEFKAKTKNKGADHRRSAAATGGGPKRLAPLSEIENRVLAMIGPIAVSGLQGVSIPVDLPVDNPAPSNIDIEIEIVRSPPSLSPISRQPTPMTSTSPVQLIQTQDVTGLHPASTSQSSEPRSINTRRVLPRRRIRDDHVPQWAYEFESARVRNEARLANELHIISTSLQDLVGLMNQFLNRS